MVTSTNFIVHNLISFLSILWSRIIIVTPSANRNIVIVYKFVCAHLLSETEHALKLIFGVF